MRLPHGVPGILSEILNPPESPAARHDLMMRVARLTAAIEHRRQTHARKHRETCRQVKVLRKRAKVAELKEQTTRAALESTRLQYRLLDLKLRDAVVSKDAVERVKKAELRAMNAELVAGLLREENRRLKAIVEGGTDEEEAA